MPDVLLYDFKGSICCQMVRVTLAEKGVVYRKQTIDIVDKREQFEPWYTALNPKAVVPTLSVDGQVVCDTIKIVPFIDAHFDGPALTPDDPGAAAAMLQWMTDVMAPHYGVLLYSRNLDENRRSSTIVERGHELRRQMELRPEAAELLQKRVDGNARLQRILADADEVAKHVDGVAGLQVRLEEALKDGDFVIGNRWSLADGFWTAALARFDRHGIDAWGDGSLPRVAAYYARLQARPSFTAAEVWKRD